MSSEKYPTLISGLNPVDSTRENGIQVTSFSLSGDSHLNGIVDVVAADYHERTGRPAVTAELLQEFVGQKVTLMRDIGGMYGHREICAMPGTLMVVREQLFFLPKGKRNNGYLLTQWLRDRKLLDVEIGYAGVAKMQARIDEIRSHYPQVEKLTRDHLLALPSRSNTCSLAVFGTYPFMGESAPGTIWFCHSYLRGDDADIVEDMLCIRPQYGESEHGSVFGRDLLRMNVGVVTGFEPIPFHDAITFDYKTALARVSPVTVSA